MELCRGLLAVITTIVYTRGYQHVFGGTHGSSIGQVLQHLQWKTVAILKNKDYGSVADVLHPDCVGLSILVYNINPSTAHLALTQIHDQMFPHINIILDVQPQYQLAIMKLVDIFDKTMNNKTDFCHHSKWLIVSNQSEAIDTGSEIPHLENVALLLVTSSEVQTDGNKIQQMNDQQFGEIYTLLHHPNHHAFVPVNHCRCSSPECYFPNTKYRYNNRRLRVMTLPMGNFVQKEMENGILYYTGYSVDIFLLIAKELNFSYTITEPEVFTWGKKTNNTWDGIIGHLHRRDIDIAASDLTIDVERSEVVDFLYPPIATGRTTIVYSTVTQSPLLLLSRPLRWELYLAVSLSLAIVTIIYKVIKYQRSYQTNGCACSRTCIRKHSSADGGNPIGRAFFKQGAVTIISSLSGRVLMLSWWIFVTVITAVYCANLMASFSAKREIRPFSTIQEVLDSDYEISTRILGITFYSMKKSQHPLLSRLSERIQESQSHDSLLSFKEHFEKVKKGKYAFVTYITTAEEFMIDDCELDYIPELITWEHLAFAVQKGSPLKSDIESVMSRLKEGGIFEMLWRKWFKTRNSTMCTAERKVQPVSIQELAGSFIVLLAGLLVSSLILVMEYRSNFTKCVNNAVLHIASRDRTIH